MIPHAHLEKNGFAHGNYRDEASAAADVALTRPRIGNGLVTPRHHPCAPVSGIRLETGALLGHLRDNGAEFFRIYSSLEFRD